MMMLAGKLLLCFEDQVTESLFFVLKKLLVSGCL